MHRLARLLDVRESRVLPADRREGAEWRGNSSCRISCWYRERGSIGSVMGTLPHSTLYTSLAVHIDCFSSCCCCITIIVSIIASKLANTLVCFVDVYELINFQLLYSRISSYQIVVTNQTLPAITRLTAHVKHVLMSELVICKHRKENGDAWHKMSLVKTGVNKQHTMQTQTLITVFGALNRSACIGRVCDLTYTVLCI